MPRIRVIGRFATMGKIHSGFTASLYMNTRCTFQRLNDAKIYHGWIESIDEREVTLRLTGQQELTEGEEYVFQIFGLGHNLKFIAKLLTRLTGNFGPSDASVALCMFTVRGAMTSTDGGDNARLANQGMFAVITLDGVQIEPSPVEVIDVSANGLGVILPTNLKRGEIAQFQVSTVLGEINLNAIVKNVRAAGDGNYRVGFEIAELSRVDRLRWQQTFRQSY